MSERRLRLLVTGAQGHVGRAICKAAEVEGHVVTGVDLLGGQGLRAVDIRDTDTLARSLLGADAVIHAAGLHAPHVGHVPDEMFHSVNVNGTDSVLRAMKMSGVQRLVFTSTTAVLGGGAPDGLPARWIDDTTPVDPRTVYHRTKLAAEALVRDAAARDDVRASIVRLGRCFPEPVSIMAVHRLCRGLDPRDAAQAHLRALGHVSASPSALIVSAKPVFLKQDCALLGRLAPTMIERRCPGLTEAFRLRNWVLPDRIDRVYDSSRARDGWGWTPKWDVWSLLDD